MKTTPALRLAAALVEIERKRTGRGRNVPQPVDVAALRKRIGLTQEQFSMHFGVPVATLRHWERGDRKPRGPALVLLNVLARNPQAVMLALS